MSSFTRLRLWLGAASLLLGWLFWQTGPALSGCCSACEGQPSLCDCQPQHPEERAQAFLPLPVVLSLASHPLPLVPVQTGTAPDRPVYRISLPPSLPRELLPRGPPIRSA